MNVKAIWAALAAVFFDIMRGVAIMWDFLGDTSPWPRRYLTLREPDGTLVRALIIAQEGDAYTVEIRRSEPQWSTFWQFDAETKVVFADDISVIRIDPPAEKSLDKMLAR